MERTYDFVAAVDRGERQSKEVIACALCDAAVSLTFGKTTIQPATTRKPRHASSATP
jgi:hypothetical protein